MMETCLEVNPGSIKEDYTLKLPQGAMWETCLEVTPGSVKEDHTLVTPGCKEGDIS